jgi:type II pantothenate kinase
VKKLFITGGGAYKYNQLILQHLEVEITKVSEFDALVHGLQYIHHHQKDKIFQYSKDTGITQITQQE